MTCEDITVCVLAMPSVRDAGIDALVMIWIRGRDVVEEVNGALIRLCAEERTLSGGTDLCLDAVFDDTLSDEGVDADGEDVNGNVLVDGDASAADEGAADEASEYEGTADEGVVDEGAEFEETV